MARMKVRSAICQNAPPEVLERCQWESRPIEFPGAAEFQPHSTIENRHCSAPKRVMGRDGRAGTQLCVAAKAAAKQQREQAELRLKALEAGDAPPLPPGLPEGRGLVLNREANLH